MKIALSAMLIILIFVPTTLWAQESPASTFFWLEEMTIVSDTSTARIQGLILHDLAGDGPFGTFVWFQSDKSYSEIYAGPTLRVNSWLQVAIGAGVETGTSQIRIGGFLYAARGPATLLVALEDGGSGFWNKAELNIKVSNTFGVGLMNRKFMGTGPSFEANIGNLKVWGAVLQEHGKTTGLVGLRMSFQ